MLIESFQLGGSIGYYLFKSILILALRNNQITHHSINWTQVLLGALALALGVIVYILDRPAEHIYFLPQALSMYEQIASVFGRVGYHLPTFLHVIAFSLILTGMIGCGKRGGLIVCITWMLINSGFEIGQHQNIAPGIVELLPEWFSYVAILDNTASYFIHGVFDPYDLLSIVVGALVAYAVIRLTIKHVEYPHMI